jgi:hypothetical protein
VATPFGPASSFAKASEDKSEAGFQECKKRPGASPAFFSIVFQQALKDLELLIDGEPEIALNKASAAGGIEVGNYVIDR